MSNILELAKQFLSTLDTEADQFTFQLFIDNKNSSGGNPRIMNVELGTCFQDLVHDTFISNFLDQLFVLTRFSK